MTSFPVDFLMQAGNGSRLVVINGPNFSGRTDLLRQLCSNDSYNCVYLGPEVYNSLSGLTTTVRQEIELHSATTLERSDLLDSLDSLELCDLLNQHPGTLSGGEQASLAVICGMAIKPHRLAIDCTLEQLDEDRRRKIVNLLRSNKGPTQFSVIADNLLNEWNFPVAQVNVQCVRSSDPPPPPVPPIDARPLANLKPVTSPEIRICGLSTGYRSRPEVLKNLTIVLQPRTIYVLEGANGSGKSTWAKILCGALRPSDGKIYIGQEATYLWKTPGTVVGYHFQNPDVQLFESTVLTELFVGAKAGPHTENSASQRVEYLMEVFGLQRYSDVNPLSLPFVVRKRVAIAATLACGTPWIFLDEPTLGADATTAYAMAEVIHNLVDIGHGIIVVSHSQTFKTLLKGITLKLTSGRIMV